MTLPKIYWVVERLLIRNDGVPPRGGRWTQPKIRSQIKYCLTTNDIRFRRVMIYNHYEHQLRLCRTKQCRYSRKRIIMYINIFLWGGGGEILAFHQFATLTAHFV